MIVLKKIEYIQGFRNLCKSCDVLYFNVYLYVCLFVT